VTRCPVPSSPTRRSSDLDREDPGPPRPASEGVRIIGAEEAQAAIESGQAAPKRPDDARRFGDPSTPPPGSPRPQIRFPLADDVRSEEHTSELQSRFDLVC